MGERKERVIGSEVQHEPPTVLNGRLACCCDLKAWSKLSLRHTDWWKTTQTLPVYVEHTHTQSKKGYPPPEVEWFEAPHKALLLIESVHR